MASGAVTKVTKVVGSGIKLRSILKISFWAIFIAIMLINAIVIAIDQTPIDGLTYLGIKFISPTEDINTGSLLIIENNSAFIRTENRGFWFNLWNTILVHSRILSSLFVIYYWLKALAWVSMKVVIQDDSKSTAAWVSAIIFFILVQIIVLLIISESPMLPFNATKNGINAIKTIISPAADMADKFTNSEGLCDINATNSSCSDQAETLANMTENVINKSKNIASIV